MSDLYRHPEYRAIYAACLEDFAEGTGWAALRDWLRDRGEPECVVGEAEPMRRLSIWDVWSFGIGIGSGSGSGSGIGRGRGSGSGRGSGIGSGRGSGSGSGSGSGIGRGSGIGSGIGSGSGIGIGSGSGSGIGRGSGIGSGSGIGIGIGSGRGSGSGSGSGSGIGRGIGIGIGIGIGRGINQYEANQMEPGKAYLVHAGDWHTFVGRCVRQVGPMTYLFESVSKIQETHGGDNWEKLAAGDGDARRAASYAHYKGTACVPLTIVAIEWAGETPQEDGLPAA